MKQDGVNIDALLAEKKNRFFLKRIFDIVFSFFGLLVLSPVFLMIAVLIRVDSQGPVFFKQLRVGKGERTFFIYKFRTMVVDAEKLGLQLTVGDDQRITKTGRVLRKYKLDELAQLINVLKGDMSFVGPRPEVPKYVQLYDEYQKNILKIPQGITSIASIEYKNENEVCARSTDPEKTYIEEIMPHKIKLDMEYIRHVSVWYDIKLILKTIFQ